MVCRGYICRLVFYLPDRRFLYRYNTYNPAPKSIKNTPKTTKPTPKLKREEISVAYQQEQPNANNTLC